VKKPQRSRKPAPRRKPIKQDVKQRRLAEQHARERQEAENRAARLRGEARDRAANARLTQEQLEEYRRLVDQNWPEGSPEAIRLNELFDLRDQVTAEEIDAQLAALRRERDRGGPAPAEPSAGGGGEGTNA
jgi:hypothetical protein